MSEPKVEVPAPAHMIPEEPREEQQGEDFPDPIEDLKGDVKKREVLRHVADEYPMRFSVIRIPWSGNVLYLNAFTSFFGFAFLWGLALWCMIQPTKAYDKLTEWQASVTEMFTWFYIAANPSFTFFVLWLTIRYGHIKLGKKDEKPEFDNSSYFMMLFSAGVGVGLFFYGVSEALWHRNSHWFASLGYRGTDEVDQFAMMLTMYHWGFAAWSPYIVVAVTAGIASYRFDLPMTVRSTMYQVLGPYTWGWIGDIIDGFSIVMTVAGVCTSLGLGSMQIVTGADRLGWLEEGLTEDELTNKQVMVIWVITAIATASVISGLSLGIKLLSQIGFGLGMILLFLCLVMEKTNYIFNLTVQTVGYYFQYCLLQVPFWTDAFGQLNPGEGRSTDGMSAETWWMNSWTVFYMAWWTAWGAFVGLFLARISRGRTIREVAFYSFVAPLVYAFLWFCTFGGIGLRQARQADELEVLGGEYFNDTGYYLAPGSKYCYDVPQENVVVNGTTVFTNQLIGITPVCQLDPSDATQAWFNVMYSFSYPDDSDDFGGFGGFMAGLSLIALTLYFVTSSDSGSLIVDHLASNGDEDHHWLQRLFWSFTEGATATALLLAGGSRALGALQAASIVFGLPFNMFLFCMMYSTVQMCHIAETQDLADVVDGKLPPPEETSFKMHLFGGIANIFEYLASLGSVHEDRKARGMDLPTMFQVKEFFVGLVFPFYSLYRTLVLMEKNFLSKYGLTLSYFAFYVMWIAFFALSESNFGYVAFGFTCFFMNACILTYVRSQVRDRFSLDGNTVGDFLASSFFYPQALCQILYEFENNVELVEEKVKTSIPEVMDEAEA